MSLSKLLRESVKKRKQTLSTSRFQIQQKLFARFSDGEIPRLWTPPLCHFKMSAPNECVIDLERNCLHFEHLSNYLGGFLINGSTGDGWTMNADQRMTNLRGIFDFMASDPLQYTKPILLGVMEHNYNGKVLGIKRYVDFMEEYCADRDDLFESSPFVGFVLTPPSHTDDQREIEECLAEIISGHPGYPFVLYQLPQITKSEMSTETVVNLISRFGNITMIKDSSGTDTLLRSKRSMDGVFMVRGFEGQYMESILNLNHGVAAYHGLLLSTANNYAQHFHKMMQSLMNGQWNEAASISAMISAVSEQTFDVVKEYQFGNPFTNSAKMVDFWIANGCGGRTEIMLKNHENLPIAQSGNTYDVSALMEVRDILVSNGVIDAEYKGYLQQHRQWWKAQ